MLAIGAIQHGLVIHVDHVSAVETLIWTILRVATLIRADVLSVSTTRVVIGVNDARTGITEMPLISRTAEVRSTIIRSHYLCLLEKRTRDDSTHHRI